MNSLKMSSRTHRGFTVMLLSVLILMKNFLHELNENTLNLIKYKMNYDSLDALPEG